MCGELLSAVLLEELRQCRYQAEVSVEHFSKGPFNSMFNLSPTTVKAKYVGSYSKFKQI
jgi:hypothetical protein